MATYEVTTEDGKVYEVETADQSAPPQTLQEQLPEVAKQAGQAVMDSSPVNLTKKFFQTDPATMQRVGGPALPIAGGALLGYPGAVGGEALRQMTGAALAPETVPETTMGRAASMAAAGVMQEPKILKAIPGVPKVAEMASNLASKTGRGLAKAAEAVSGGKAGDFMETAKKGLSTYAAPSMERAKSIYAKALNRLPGTKATPTLVEKMTMAVSPESTEANKYLFDLAKRVDKGELVDARQALKAKQSLDKIIDTVPVWQRNRRGDLFAIKSTFDDILTSQSGQMKKASNIYRSAILKENMSKPLHVNKHGDYSKLAPMMATLGASVGAPVGGHSKGTEGAILGGLTPLAMMVASSPGAFGLAGAAGGSTVRGLQVLGKNPVIRQALLGVLQKILAHHKNGKESK